MENKGIDTLTYADVEKILRDYRAYSEKLEDESGGITWADFLRDLFDPAFFAPHDQDVRGGDLSGLANSIFSAMNQQGPHCGSVIKSMLEICMESPCDSSDLNELTWYYDQSLKLLDQAKAAGVISEKQYGKLKQGIEEFPPARLMQIDQEAERRAKYRAQGLCQYCGGSFVKGLLSLKCGACGKKKDY